MYIYMYIFFISKNYINVNKYNMNFFGNMSKNISNYNELWKHQIFINKC